MLSWHAPKIIQSRGCRSPEDLLSGRPRVECLGRRIAAKAGNTLNDCFHVICRDEPRALELPRRVLVARAPQKIFMVEPMMRVVPAAVARVIVDHSVRGREFV